MFAITPSTRSNTPHPGVPLEPIIVEFALRFCSALLIASTSLNGSSFPIYVSESEPSL